jgi:hypothetical protein
MSFIFKQLPTKEVLYTGAYCQSLSEEKAKGLSRPLANRKRLDVCHGLAVVVGGSSGLLPTLGQPVVVFDFHSRFLARRRRRRSFKGYEVARNLKAYKGIVIVTS